MGSKGGGARASLTAKNRSKNSSADGGEAKDKAVVRHIRDKGKTPWL
jgi:hypothetical protein